MERGKQIGVRKISNASRPGHVRSMETESAVYEWLMKFPDFRAHVIPFIRSVPHKTRGPGSVRINFEYRPGQDLHELLSKPDISSVDKINLAIKCAEALLWLASKNVTHGDIKPDNFFVDEAGNVLLMDFGLADIGINYVNGDFGKLSNTVKDRTDFIEQVLVHLVSTPLLADIRKFNRYVTDQVDRIRLEQFYSEIVRMISMDSVARNNTRRT